MAAILDAILNISISPMMPRWHHSVSMYRHIGEHIYAKTFCADYFFGLHPKSSFGNQTIRCPKSWAHYSCLIIMCLNIGTPNNHHFPFGTNGKVVVLGVPILKHFRVYFYFYREIMKKSYHRVFIKTKPYLDGF